VVPICKCDNGILWSRKCQSTAHSIPGVSLTVVYIIQMALGIPRVIDHQWPAQAIAVLGLVMTVIPIGPLKQRQRDQFDHVSEVGA